MLLAAALLLVLGGTMAGLGYKALMNMRAAKAGDPIEVVIPKGAGLGGIAQRLHQAGVIGNQHLFMLAARLKRVSGRIKAGEYAIRPNTSLAEILQILGRGRVLTHTVTIPEGFSLKQIVARLAAAGLVEPKRAPGFGPRALAT